MEKYEFTLLIMNTLSYWNRNNNLLIITLPLLFIDLFLIATQLVWPYRVAGMLEKIAIFSF